MSILNSFKKTLGLPNSDEPDDSYGVSSSAPYVNPFRKDNNGVNAPAEMASSFVDANDAGDELDIEFAGKLEQVIAGYINKIKARAQQEKNALKSGASSADEKIEDLQKQLQAAQAQLKTAQSRQQDLTNKVMTLQADYEQLDLEKKSLMNKLRVVEMRDDDTSDMEKEIVRLNTELDEANAKLAKVKNADGELLTPEQIAEKDQEIEKLNAQVAEQKEQLTEANEQLSQLDQLQEEIEKITQIHAQKDEEIASLKGQVEQMQDAVKQRDDMKQQLDNAGATATNLQKIIDQLNLKAKTTAEQQNRRDINLANSIDALKQQIADAKALAQGYKAKLDEQQNAKDNTAEKIAQLEKEREDAKAEVKQVQLKLEKKQHELQAATEALAEKDRRITAFVQQMTGSLLSPNADEQKPAANPSTPSADQLDSDDWMSPNK